ncbi:MAG TPA: FkbM family methyltransferase [Gemmatimonadaceae bacterium]|nr:FkbM family methyltransferase [Gemmatimonadaceae bacterium]
MPNPAPNPLAERMVAYLRNPAWVARRVAWEVLRRTRDEVVIPTDVGAVRVRTANRVIGTQLYTRRAYEAALMRGALEALAAAGHGVRGRTAADVGANIGMTTLALLHVAGARRVVAVEPEPRNVADLRGNLTRNGVSERVAVHHAAASDRAGTVTLELADVNYGDHRVRTAERSADGPFGEAARPTISVTARTLDELLEGEADIAVLWIDVQGHDAAVLRGAARTAARGVPAVTECWPYGAERAGVGRAEYLTALASHYRTAVALDEEGRPGPAGAVREVAGPVWDALARGIADRTLVLLP